MAEGGYERMPTEVPEGTDNQGQDENDYDDDNYIPTQEEWERFMEVQAEIEEEKRKQSDADKYKGKVSEKTYNRWASQEERQGSQEKPWTWEEKRSYEEYKEHHGLEMKDRDGTIRSSTSKEKGVEETSLGGTMTLEMREEERNEVEKEALKIFPNMDRKYLPRIKFDDFGRLVYKGDKIWKDGEDRNKTYIIAENGKPSYDYTLKSKLPDGLKKALGKSNLQINNENIKKQRIEEEHQAKREQELEKLKRRRVEIQGKRESSRGRLEEFGKELEECEKIMQGLPTIQEAEEVRKRIPQIKEGMRVEGGKIRANEQETEVLKQNITKQEEDVNIGEQQVETARERVNQRLLSLRDRIKEIFKKHGFTVVAVASAIGVVIGVIVNSLKAGLTNLAKGVGNGLKELGAKLGQLLPGMIGAIASFIFKTAGEVIGFLAKNAWLLIVGLVVLAVEQFKKRSR